MSSISSPQDFSTFEYPQHTCGRLSILFRIHGITRALHLQLVLRVTSYELAKSGPPIPFVGAFGETRETGKQGNRKRPARRGLSMKSGSRKGFGRKRVWARLWFDSLVSFWAYLNALVLDMRSTARRSYEVLTRRFDQYSLIIGF